MDFLQKLDRAVDKNDSLLCVGLDPDPAKLPEHFRSGQTPQFDFNKAIIDATADIVCAFKPNAAFYEARGTYGIAELKQTCDYLRQYFPDIPIILDFKRGDIGNTNAHSAAFAFEYLGVDAITVQPYQGRQAVQAFLDYKDKGIIVLCRTSNEGAEEFQDMVVDGEPLYLQVAKHVAGDWNDNGNCLLVLGGTHPSKIVEVRETIGHDMVFLVPGLGAQGGEAQAVVKAGVNKHGRGLIINASRSVLFASGSTDCADAARAVAASLRDEINRYRKDSD